MLISLLILIPQSFKRSNSLEIHNREETFTHSYKAAVYKKKEKERKPVATSFSPLYNTLQIL